MTATRTERDSFGTIEVPQDGLWGAQTARSLQFFAIGSERMPLEIIQALAWIKWAAALVHADLGLIDASKAQAIALAAEQVALGMHDDAFPVSVWQTGSGTHSNMNVNEVVATLATRALSTEAGAASTVDPHDDVNRGQSSNDVFPSAMHIAAALQTRAHLLPAVAQLHESLCRHAVTFKDVWKIGRTHLQDATPVTVGQEFAAYAAQLALAQVFLQQALSPVCTLALGGTAVGNGMHTHPEFGARAVAKLATQLKLPLSQAPNLLAATAGHEALVGLHGAFKMSAVALTKIAGDLRLMGSGPRAGLGDLMLPANEPGSSIMPGKVNPTQIEALTMVCLQVLGNDVAIGFAASQGQLELNTYKPLIALNTLNSVRLLGDAIRSFDLHCVQGLRVDTARVDAQWKSSLMLVTFLVPHIGYDRAAQIAQQAQSQGTTLREAALELGLVTGDDFDQWVTLHS